MKYGVQERTRGFRSKAPMPWYFKYLPDANTITIGMLIVLATVAWQTNFWFITPVCWIILAYIGHTLLLSFHEVSHANLGHSWLANELRGIVTGSLIMTPLSVYRFVHGTHHAYLASRNDLELWPYTNPAVPRWRRQLMAAGELFCGFFVTPLIFLRGVLRGPVPASLRSRIAAEYALAVLAWAVALTAIHTFGWWQHFAVGYFIPAFLAGNVQSIRKFTEHMGLFGNSPLTVTRTVTRDKPFGKFVSCTVLHNDHHGTHHRYAKLPYHVLPEITRDLYRNEREAIPPFPNYASAFLDMLPTLVNPRIGRQWLALPARSCSNEPVESMADDSAHCSPGGKAVDRELASLS